MTTRYRVLRPIDYPTDPAVIARLVAGENLPFDQRGSIKSVRVGQVVDDIPAVSIPWLLADGDIEEVKARG